MKKSLFAVAVSFALAAPAYAAGPQPGKFSMSVFGGTDTPVSGNVHDGATAAVPDLGPLNPALASVSAELRIQPRSHEDIYDNAMGYGLEFAYGLNQNAEIFGQIRRTETDPGTVQVGGAFVPALNTTLPVYGTFSDYKATTVEAGYRHYLMEPGYTRPFIAGRLRGDAEGLADRDQHADVDAGAGGPLLLGERRVGDGDAGIGDLEGRADVVGLRGAQAAGDERARVARFH